jgi:hypothetical protein
VCVELLQHVSECESPLRESALTPAPHARGGTKQTASTVGIIDREWFLAIAHGPTGIEVRLLSLSQRDNATMRHREMEPRGCN